MNDRATDFWPCIVVSTGRPRTTSKQSYSRGCANDAMSTWRGDDECDATPRRIASVLSCYRSHYSAAPDEPRQPRNSPQAPTRTASSTFSQSNWSSIAWRGAGNSRCGVRRQAPSIRSLSWRKNHAGGVVQERIPRAAHLSRRRSTGPHRRARHPEPASRRAIHADPHCQPAQFRRDERDEQPTLIPHGRARRVASAGALSDTELFAYPLPT